MLFSKFINENRSKINFEDGVMKDHHINEIIKEQIMLPFSIPNLKYEILDFGSTANYGEYKVYRQLISRINNYVRALDAFLKWLANNTDYIDFNKYKECLIKIANSICSYIKNEEPDSKVYFVLPNQLDNINILVKSNFWVLMLVYNVFIENNVYFTVIEISKMELKKGDIYIYPDDTIYSGTQFCSAFKKKLCAIIENSNNGILIPLRKCYKKL
jgi:hypothetical protein